MAAARVCGHAVNRELISPYRDIDRAVVEQQRSRGWGQSIVERISRALRASFPGDAGLLGRNVWDMRRLYEEHFPTRSTATACRRNSLGPPRRASAHRCRPASCAPLCHR
ncbi:DUF1016 N-terminal domain-containing protein [Variovorax sp. LjRoot178]|uniref:DUF1016 N-terminal domain-containing protein n=1 Tax=Variovorax sp. LjRoot178 TaxID=3342277 RepID=UPI003F510659